MIKNSKIILFFLLIILMNSCGGFSDAGKVLRNEKTRTTDEFLVKKREPLSLPPDYENLPKPNSLEKNNKNEENTINTILKMPKETTSSKKNSTVEQSIINEIRK